MSNLRTNYKNDVYSGSRKYRVTNNSDGTISLTDVTSYSQRGDTYGAAQLDEINDIVNKLDNKAYRTTDSVLTDIADNDYIPIYDTSASATKKTLWSSIRSFVAQTFIYKVHISTYASAYGAGNENYYGHIKLSDRYTSESPRGASQSVGASEQALTYVYSGLQDEVRTRTRETSNISANIRNHFTANNNLIYMDYHDGKYGINTSAQKGADTFIPFS